MKRHERESAVLTGNLRAEGWSSIDLGTPYGGWYTHALSVDGSQGSIGILLYFAKLEGSMVTVSVQPWWPKQIVQCATSQTGSTRRQVSHISPRARMSVEAWQKACETIRGSASFESVWAIDLLIL